MSLEETLHWKLAQDSKIEFTFLAPIYSRLDTEWRYRVGSAALERILRIVLTLVIAIASVGWIVFSYLPDTLVDLPRYRFATEGMARTTAQLLVLIFVVVIALQVWLTIVTGRSVARFNKKEISRNLPFQLNVGMEVVLTAIPIGFTAVLAIAVYGWWRGLSLLP